MIGMEKRESIQNEAYNKAKDLHRRTIVMSVGAGKTKVALEVAKAYSKVHVCVPKVSMFKTWKDENEKHGINADLCFTTYRSLQNLNPAEVEFIILDEVHSVTLSHVDWIRKLYKGPILGLTGTPPIYGIKKEIVKYNLPICYEIYEDDVIDMKIINDYRIIVHGIDLDNRKNITVFYGPDKSKSFITSEVLSYNKYAGLGDPIKILSALSSFNSKIEYIKQLAKNITNKTIIFVNKKSQADEIGISYHSDNPDSVKNLEDFSEGMINQIVCVQQLNEGINIPNLETGIIMHAYSNPRLTKQRIGRLLRLSPDMKCTVHILCYKKTIEEQWLRNALSDYDSSKITYVTNIL
jgi:superfamily II DNA or RNA helicase